MDHLVEEFQTEIWRSMFEMKPRIQLTQSPFPLIQMWRAQRGPKRAEREYYEITPLPAACARQGKMSAASVT